MKLDALLVSYFLAGNAECFVSPSFTVQKIEGRISFQNCDATTVHRTCNSQLDATARPNQSRKRSRSQATSVKNSTARDLAASSAAADDAGSVTFFFPSRLRETVERLDREPDLKSKSKLLVELGDIFALTESAVLPPGDDEGRRWRPQKVPGCVSEVYVAASVTKGGALSEGSDFLVRDGGAVATRSAVVSIRGTADARLSRGILALLANGLEGQSPDTVLNLRGKALAAAVGLRAGLTDSRINGLGNILGVIQDQVRDHLDSAAGAGVVESSKDAVAVSGPTLGLSGGALDQGRNWGSDASSWSPLPGAGNEVAMLLSGGVDSSVAMRLLQDQGYRIRAFYLKIWLEDELSHLGECPWEEDLEYATAVCEQAGVSLEVVPLQREYWEQVVSYTVREAHEGRTPNPDVICNSRIKFGMFYDHVGRHFRHVATGHYARLEHREGGVRLFLSPDAVKDQTYFLCALNQAQLQKALFPVGEYTKAQIRELAESYDLPTKKRKDSQGICFLGKLKFDDFLRHYLGEMPGTVIDRKTGNAIGEHRGLWFHTIGQRKGVGSGLRPGYVNLGPWYVSGKDMVANVLEVTNDRNAIEGPRETFQVEALRWIAGRPTVELEREGSMRLQVKTRHGPHINDCVLRLLPIEENMYFEMTTTGGAVFANASSSGVPGGLEDDGFLVTAAETREISTSAQGFVRLDSKESALAPGQFAAFYLGDECLGSGVINGSSVVEKLGVEEEVGAVTENSRLSVARAAL